MTTQTQVNPTLLTYLFAERFADPVKGLSALVGGIVAPRSSEKVNLQALTTTLYVSAIMELVESGAAALEMVEVKKLFGKENVLALALHGQPAGALSDLAVKIAQAAQAAKKPEERRVRNVVIRVVGGRQSTIHPWLMAVKPVITEAEGAGYVHRPAKEPNLMKAMFNPLEAASGVAAEPNLVNPLEGSVAALKERINRFELSLGASAGQLRKEIVNGVNDCKDNSD